MPTIQPDFTEVAEVKPGTYSARIVDSEVRTSQNDNQYVKWTMEVFGTGTPADGMKVWTNTMVAGRGAGRLKTLFRAATGEEPAGPVDTGVLHGREVQITVVDGRNQQGQPTGFAEVKAISPLA